MAETEISRELAHDSSPPHVELRSPFSSCLCTSTHQFQFCPPSAPSAAPSSLPACYANLSSMALQVSNSAILQAVLQMVSQAHDTLSHILLLEVGTVIEPILWRRKLSLRDVEELARGHLTNMGLSKKSALTPKLVFFATRFCCLQLFLK